LATSTWALAVSDDAAAGPYEEDAYEEDADEEDADEQAVSTASPASASPATERVRLLVLITDVLPW
jgi:hypothetical protein